MPLHLLGKKSWNVYSPANIARVKADEAAAAAREAADEQRMQDLDAERRAAVLRGQTPPPLPEEATKHEKRKDGHDRKRRRLAGEDDTDRDIRLAKGVTEPMDSKDAAVLKLRKPMGEASLTDQAGNINLFPVDLKEAAKREKNAEAEKEKRKKEQEFQDQYTMRFSNAAGKGGLEQPWYTTGGPKATEGKDGSTVEFIGYPGFGSKDVWGNEDPQRKEREQMRITSNDPLAFMNWAQVQLKKSREDRKKWAEARDRELRELRAAEERERRRDRHGKRKKQLEEDELEDFSLDAQHHERGRSSKHKHHRENRSRSRSRSRNRSRERRHDRRHSRSRSREREHRRRRKESHRLQREDRHRVHDQGGDQNSRRASRRYD